MTPIDDLSVGDFVAITKEHAECDCMECRNIRYDGNPLLIQAISLPFMLVYDGKGMESIDLRYFEVVKLDKKYVNKLIKHTRDTLGIAVGRMISSISKELQHTGKCPRCGTQMERAEAAENIKIIACNNCGFCGRDN